MHLVRILSVCALPLAVFAVAQPRQGWSVTEYAKQKRVEHMREMRARQKYPDLFPIEKRGPSDPPGPGCDFRRKRDAINEQVLTAQETALFLVGHGSFTSTNGTFYHDPHYVAMNAADHKNELKNFGSRWYKRIVNKVGDLLLEVTLPQFVNWKSNSDPESLYYLSQSTAFRIKDVDDLLDELLNTGMEEFQYGALRINRRWIEAAQTITSR